MKVSRGIVAAVMVIFLASCANMSKEQLGAMIGAGTGALLGNAAGKNSAFLTVAGAVVGALVGAEVGRYMDRQDAILNNRAFESAAKYGGSYGWRNQETGNSGVWNMGPAVTTSDGYCREYQQKVIIGGREVEAYGIACREPDGSWRIVR